MQVCACVCVFVCVYSGLQRKGNMILAGFRGPHTRSERDLAVKFKMASWRVKGEKEVQGVSSFVNPGCFFSLDCATSLHMASRGHFFEAG